MPLALPFDVTIAQVFYSSLTSFSMFFHGFYVYWLIQMEGNYEKFDLHNSDLSLIVSGFDCLSHSSNESSNRRTCQQMCSQEATCFFASIRLLHSLWFSCPRVFTVKLWIYEIHIFELRNEEINVKKILAANNATYAVAKRKLEKIRLAGTRTLTSATPVQRSNQLS